ncbi:DUF817 domain-containing protein [Nonomuraea sp. NPDC050540]|uniref:DUF817 domain-containing protein n=1 Tax=Nonomuraea sp. NPDC050540 TaxID=3364367 RepID=UPI0037B970B7
MTFSAAQLIRFACAEARSCRFAVAMFAGLAASSVLPLPIPRYDALLVYAVAVTVIFRALRWESTQETVVIAGFHLIGLAFELIKVRFGSWSYPGDAFTKFGGVPLYSGFLYAAVGSYICAAWRIFALRLVAYRTRPVTLVALAIYANFVTQHWWIDLRIPLALALVLATWGTVVHFTVGEHRYQMPLAQSLVLIGFFLWVAENIATYLGAWQYPHQRGAWQLVHPAKFGAWALLVSVTFVMVACWQGRRGRLHLRPPGRTRGWALPLRRLDGQFSFDRRAGAATGASPARARANGHMGPAGSRPSAEALDAAPRPGDEELSDQALLWRSVAGRAPGGHHLLQRVGFRAHLGAGVARLCRLGGRRGERHSREGGDRG